jgi:beta-N-acetylhexosaminidase
MAVDQLKDKVSMEGDFDLAKWTLRLKIGQLLQCGFDGLEPTEDIVRLIREHAIGGVILFARNVRDNRQVAR